MEATELTGAVLDRQNQTTAITRTREWKPNPVNYPHPFIFIHLILEIVPAVAIVPPLMRMSGHLDKTLNSELRRGAMLVYYQLIHSHCPLDVAEPRD
ncbi:hypothetical protein BDW59DRAFT_77702 [Aspergillus cavernicola]|uniref:Uncharacterized protein n=1 Tax=Aspergillus cavernicola TaxID=176166 RepID=A0ABR4IZQ0_9EURO